MDVGRLCILLAGFWRASKQLGPPFPPMKRSFSSSHERKEFHGLFLPPLSPIFSVDFGGKEGKSRLAGNYEAAVLLRPQSPCDFYSPFQEVVRNRTTVQYHKKKKKKKRKKKYPCGQWWSVTRKILRSTLENAEHGGHNRMAKRIPFSIERNSLPN